MVCMELVLDMEDVRCDNYMVVRRCMHGIVGSELVNVLHTLEHITVVFTKDCSGMLMRALKWYFGWCGQQSDMPSLKFCTHIQCTK